MAPDETVAEAILRGARRLAAAGIEDAALDTRLLLAWILDADRLALLRRADEPLPAGAAARFEATLRARGDGRPVSRITGERWFWGLRFEIDDAVLDPRPESEGLVEAVIARVASDAALRLLDLGTGSGCLLLALLSELPHADGFGIDCSAAALDRARGNAEALGLAARAHFRTGTWTQDLDGPFDVVVANPPYIPSDEIDTLSTEVAGHDPRGALDGGTDGLDAYRAILADLPRLLVPDGLAVLELGIGQAPPVRNLAQAAGLRLDAVVDDLAGIPRCLVVHAGKESINR